MIWDALYVQGYPQRMKLQRRLYGSCLVRFLAFKVPCRPKLAYFSKPSKYSFKCTETKIQASNRHIFSVLGRLYSLILCE